MKIEITKNGRQFVADCKDCTGSPPLGRGRSTAEAIGDLVLRLNACIDVQTWRQQSGLPPIDLVQPEKPAQPGG